ncbi:MAG: hypothetical protein ABID63_14635, partial [Pseudomonadota bacterium]
ASFLWPKRKNPQSTRLCGFRSGRICPVDFSVMPQQKEQIKNFFQKSGKNFACVLSFDRKGCNINEL